MLFVPEEIFCILKNRQEGIIKKIHAETWNWTSWVWVMLCAGGIYATIPLARGFQQMVYETFGKEFFTYTVFIIIASGLVTLLYFFIFRLRIKRVSQYVVLIFCAGLYMYFTVQLGSHPEEAIHFLEYALLSFFVFRALRYRVTDWTIYISASFFVMFFGTVDEFLQWMTPSRVWDYRDVGINFMAGVIFLFAVWKGIRPAEISSPVRSYSVQILVSIITVNLIFLAICLSNTPDKVRRYTTAFHFLSWLQQEEAMTEFGYNHFDPETGHFNSRFRLEELGNIDTAHGDSLGKLIADDTVSGLSLDDMVNKYKTDAKPFLYELLIHHQRRVNKAEEFHDSSGLQHKSEIAKKLLIENLIVRKYFSKTFLHSGLEWNEPDMEKVKKAASQWEEEYTSNTGRLITLVDLNSARVAILTALFITWIGGEIWKRKLSAG
jgi:Ca2+/Na+ antiporter